MTLITKTIEKRYIKTIVKYNYCGFISSESYG